MKKEDEFEMMFGEDPGGFGTDKAVLILIGCFLASFGLVILALIVWHHFR